MTADAYEEIAARIAKQRAAIYVITDDHGFVKVGYSADPQERLYDLSSASPRPLRLVEAFPVNPDDAREIEQAIHRMPDFKRRHTRGEWFRMNPERAAWLVADKLAQMARHDASPPAADKGRAAIVGRRDLIWTGHALHFRRAPVATIERDATFPNMWRVILPDGRSSDMANLDRAKEAAICLALADLDTQETVPEAPPIAPMSEAATHPLKRAFSA